MTKQEIMDYLQNELIHESASRDRLAAMDAPIAVGVAMGKIEAYRQLLAMMEVNND